MSSNRSPSPLSSRNCRNSEANSTTRKSFNVNSFARPNSLINPKTSNPFTPANTPAATDVNKRTSVMRKSVGNCSMFQDGKENHNRKDAFRSPAKTGSKNFMAPTISAASKFTPNPSPRKQILAEKNDDPKPVERKELVLESLSVDEVNLASSNDDFDGIKIRPLCCSPISSPIVPVTESDPNPPPYDPKKNFLSPRPQYLRYKPNPRIEFLLNQEESDVTRLEESFNLSDNSSSDTEENEPEKEPEKEAEFSDDSVSSVTEEKEPELVELSVCEAVLEEKPIDLKVEKASKPRVSKGFLGSKTVWFVFVLFLVACFSLSFTESPPIDLPIYEDVGFLEVYQGSLRIAAFAKESFDGLVENIKKWSIDQKSYFFPSHNIEDLQFFNLTTSPIQEEFQFNRRVGTDYIQEFEETERVEEEEDFEETDEESDVIDEVVIEDETDEQIETETEEIVAKKSNLDEVLVSKLEQIDEVVIEEPISEQIQSEIEDIVEEKSNLDDGFVSKSEAIVEVESEIVENDLEVKSNQSMVTVCVAGFFVMVMAVSTVFYMKKKKTNGSQSANIVANNDSMREESGSSESNNMKKGYKKHTRESLAASSSSNFSTSDSFGSFTTFERIAIKHKDEVMLTPIRRSSRLVKHQAAVCL
ncbi:uncharacterized protein LOC143536523 [Bidens hawaiensis]|uniref:uncharacterized protein LOC143536523 n=1 Tax=Bidens hawaiensis TaxID=980011 RepID=UPI00404A77DB